MLNSEALIFLVICTVSVFFAPSRRGKTSYFGEEDHPQRHQRSQERGRGWEAGYARSGWPPRPAERQQRIRPLLPCAQSSSLE
jgi:hypothetical protein